MPDLFSLFPDNVSVPCASRACIELALHKRKAVSALEPQFLFKKRVINPESFHYRERLVLGYHLPAEAAINSALSSPGFRVVPSSLVVFSSHIDLMNLQNRIG